MALPTTKVTSTCAPTCVALSIHMKQKGSLFWDCPHSYRKHEENQHTYDEHKKYIQAFVFDDLDDLFFLPAPYGWSTFM